MYLSTFWFIFLFNLGSAVYSNQVTLVFVAHLFCFHSRSGFWLVKNYNVYSNTFLYFWPGPNGKNSCKYCKRGSGGSCVNLSWFLSPLSHNQLFLAHLFCFHARSYFQLVGLCTRISLSCYPWQPSYTAMSQLNWDTLIVWKGVQSMWKHVKFVFQPLLVLLTGSLW